MKKNDKNIYALVIYLKQRGSLSTPHSPCVRDAGTAASPKPPAPLALVSLALSQSPPVQTKRGPLLVSSNTSRPCARSNTIAQPRALARPAPRRAFVAVPRAAVASQVPSTVNCREHCAAMLTSTPSRANPADNAHRVEMSPAQRVHPSARGAAPPHLSWRFEFQVSS